MASKSICGVCVCVCLCMMTVWISGVVVNFFSLRNDFKAIVGLLFNICGHVQARVSMCGMYLELEVLTDKVLVRIVVL